VSGEWEIPTALWLPDEDVTVMDVDPVEAWPDEPTAPCLSLRDVLARAAGPAHEEDLIKYLVLDRLDR
jgi:hypothetical protein